MGYVTREPHIFGSVQPTAGELRELAYMDLDQNAYGSIFISNTNDTTPDKVRLAVKPLMDLFLDPSYSIQIANIGLDYGCRIYGYSQNGFVNFNMTGDLIRTIL
jgi:hypothetical protein